MAKKSIGKNIDFEINGSKLVMTVDLSKDFGPSASGKTIIIATSQGNKDVGDVKVGLNVYKYAEEKPKGKK